MAKGKQTLYTQQGYQELVDELYRRTHEEREKIKNDIATARGFGDLSENAEYDAARNDQAKNEARIKELEELIENAVILDESNIDSSVISLGSTVKVLNKTFNAEFTYALVGSNEANTDAGQISNESPLGHALLGAVVGEKVSVAAPIGAIEYEVLEIVK